MKQFILLTTSFFCLFGFSQTEWQSKSKLPFRKEQAVTFTIGNFGYVGTGIDENSRSTNDFWKYDLLTDTWSQIDTIPTSRRFGAVGFSLNNKGYVCEGVTFDGRHDRAVWEYDPQIDLWIQRANMPDLMYFRDCVTGFSINNRGYILALNNLYNFYMYRPDLNLWVKKARFPGSCTQDPIGVSFVDKGYIIGGFGNPNYCLEVWEYDPDFDQWTRRADLPEPRVYAISFAFSDKIYLGLGAKNYQLIYNDFLIYSPTEDSWKRTEPIAYCALDPFSFTIGSKAYFGSGLGFCPGPDFWEISLSTSVDYPLKQKELYLFPNPVKSLVHMFSGSSIIESVTIMTCSGAFLKNFIGHWETIDLSNLPSGIYYVMVKTKTGVSYHKLIKE